MKPDCRDCQIVTATDASGYTAAGIRSCDAHKRQYVRQVAAARAANPEIDAVHRMIDAYRNRAQR